ncbi:MerR family transcriptional regulator [Actinoallomurus sp. NPDC050550]|uniref:MerR family transcriptional regulator n=1 Tax=Actinoallomurus sp. NPDC050550 TaxID=3154937 RepID=UPI0033E3074E
MFAIGDFARYGQVSVRMLRHYDAIGLLRPAHVDGSTGYRRYEADQLRRLNQIVALKDLGFNLEQVRAMLDEQVSAEELRGMLRLRRAELERSLAADAARLVRVEARLRSLDAGTLETGVVVKRVAAVRVAQLSGEVGGFESDEIWPVVGSLFDQLCSRMTQVGVAPAGPGVTRYADGDASPERLVVHAAFPLTADPDGSAGFEIVELPEIATAATIVHAGPMANVVTAVQTLAYWIDAHGYQSLGYPREVNLECPRDRPDAWVTELQEPITMK